MKKLLAIICIGVFITAVIAWCSQGRRNEFLKELDSLNAVRVADSIDSVRMVIFADSLREVERVEDSIKNAEIIEKYKPLFTEKKDEFSSDVWVAPKARPYYRNQNGVYCYFCKDRDTGDVCMFRFVFQYTASRWLFIEDLVFNIDDEIYHITPKIERDCGNGGQIWEWCDVWVHHSNAIENGVDDLFIKALSNAKSVKIKMDGSQYYDTRTLTSKQIYNIKAAYEYYKALGGKL